MYISIMQYFLAIKYKGKQYEKYWDSVTKRKLRNRRGMGFRKKDKKQN